jgi:hypothetical protein
VLAGPRGKLDDIEADDAEQLQPEKQAAPERQNRLLVPARASKAP